MKSQHIIAIAALAASALSFTSCNSTLGHASHEDTYHQNMDEYSQQHLALMNDRAEQVNGAIADIDKAMTYTTRISAATYASTKRDIDSLLQLTAKEIAAARSVNNAHVNAAATTLELRCRELQLRMNILKTKVR
jgi:hypothetical protein